MRGKDDRKQGRGNPRGQHLSRDPIQGAAQRWAGRPRPRPEQGLAVLWERAPGKEGGRRPGVPTKRMQEATWSHRSMLSSVGLEKQVCNSFSQNSSSSWIRRREILSTGRSASRTFSSQNNPPSYWLPHAHSSSHWAFPVTMAQITLTCPAHGFLSFGEKSLGPPKLVCRRISPVALIYQVKVLTTKP